MDDVILQKAASLERCIMRIREDFDETFDKDFTKQDAVILNLQRACQAVIDMATHIVRVRKLGVPDKSTAVFHILRDHHIIDDSMCRTLINMVGFRNIAVHEYRASRHRNEYYSAAPYRSIEV